MLAISRTSPFRQFQAGIGRSTYRLNTIVVGLELIALGGDKPEQLHVKWNKPAAPEIARQVANQARSFALVSAMVYGADLFDTFLRGTAGQAWLGFQADAVRIAGRHGSGPGGHEYSMRERALALCVELGVNSDPLPATLDLLAKWRNNLVHGSYRRERQLLAEVRSRLTDAADHLNQNYSNIDISRTLRSFEDGAHPSRKDTTVLLACIQNLARNIDIAAIRRALPNEASMEALADRLLSERWKRDAADHRGWAEFCDTWERSPHDRAKNIVKVLGQLAITRTTEPVSPLLRDSYVEDLASLDREKAAERLQLIG